MQEIILFHVKHKNYLYKSNNGRMKQVGLVLQERQNSCERYCISKPASSHII